MNAKNQKTKIVNLHKDSYDVYIGRAGKGKEGYFGNPIRLEGGTRKEVLKRYKEYFYQRLENDAEFKQRVLELKGKTLGCFCKPKSCHGDTIVEYLNSLDAPNIFAALD